MTIAGRRLTRGSSSQHGIELNVHEGRALWCILVGVFVDDEDDGIVKISIYSFA
jgi:hypothetical protein